MEFICDFGLQQVIHASASIKVHNLLRLRLHEDLVQVRGGGDRGLGLGAGEVIGELRRLAVAV